MKKTALAPLLVSLLLLWGGCSLARSPIAPGTELDGGGFDGGAFDVGPRDTPIGADTGELDAPAIDAPSPTDAPMPIDAPLPPDVPAPPDVPVDAPCAAGPDRDGDGVVDVCDPCPDDRPDDPDGDGVCTAVDRCPAGNDAADRDGDGTPNACDPCPDDATNDSDGDGSCDSVDLCPGFDDDADVDGDGSPDGCDDWPCGVRPTVGLPVTRDEATITSLSLGGGGNVVVAAGGTALSVAVGYTIADCGCTDCIDQIEIGLVPGRRAFCAYDGNPPMCPASTTGNRTREITVPTASGLYDVRFARAQDFGCNYMGRTDWWLGPPSDAGRIGVICVP